MKGKKRGEERGDLNASLLQDSLLWFTSLQGRLVNWDLAELILCIKMSWSACENDRLNWVLP